MKSEMPQIPVHTLFAFPSFLLATVVAIAAPARGGSDPSALCLRAAQSAANRNGVPYEVLLAVAVVETGRDRRPWPWTVNLGGEGHWLDGEAEAVALVATAIDKGATNIDIGCFQLNYRWHAEAFASLADMLDPDQNADYAAKYLAAHFAKTGDWALAAAAYHSATPEHADRYRAKFEETYTTLADAGLDGAMGDGALAPVARLNSFPLLVAGGVGLRGSLVPATSGGQRLIGQP